MKGCINWTGAIARSGYGVFKVGGRNGSVVYAHRMAYRLYIGEIIDGKMVCHRCDNKRCINPKHFFLGTGRENSMDAWEKGLIKPPPTMIGEKNPASRLTTNMVQEIKRRLARGHTGRELARSFKVTPAAISAINVGKTWRAV